MVDIVVLDRLSIVNFFEEKVHPRQNPGYAYGLFVRHFRALRLNSFCTVQQSDVCRSFPRKMRDGGTESYWRTKATAVRDGEACLI